MRDLRERRKKMEKTLDKRSRLGFDLHIDRKTNNETKTTTTMKTTTIRTVGNVRDEKHLADAKLTYNEMRAIIKHRQRRRQEYIDTYIAAQLREYPQIGTLNGGKFYAYVNGNYVESLILSRVIAAIKAAR